MNLPGIVSRGKRHDITTADIEKIDANFDQAFGDLQKLVTVLKGKLIDLDSLSDVVAPVVVPPPVVSTFSVFIAASGAVSGSAYATTTQTLTTATTTALALDAHDFQAGALHSAVTNNSRVTAAVAGRYSFTGHVVFAGNATGQRFIALRKGGSVFLATTRLPNNGAGVLLACEVSCLVALAAGEYVELLAFQDSGGNLAVGDATNRFNQTALSWFQVA